VAPRSAARHVLERPGVLVNVDHVQERLEQMPVVGVSMPALRRFALVPRNGWCVPEVDVLELRPHADVAVPNVEQPPVVAESQPRIVECELDTVGVLPHEELLAFTPP